jgi:hypothetical protein
MVVKIPEPFPGMVGRRIGIRPGHLSCRETPADENDQKIDSGLPTELCRQGGIPFQRSVQIDNVTQQTFGTKATFRIVTEKEMLPAFLWVLFLSRPSIPL